VVNEPEVDSACTRALRHVCVLMHFDKMEKHFECSLRQTFRSYPRVTAVLGL